MNRLAAIMVLLLCAMALAGEGERKLTDKERRSFKEAFEKLGSEEYKERKAAAEAIQALGPPVLPLLEERKGNPDPEVDEAVKRLIKTIRLDLARRRLAGMIKETGIDDDIDEILGKLDSDKEEDRLEALNRVSVRNTPSCVPVVKLFLDDDSDTVVDTAIAVLRRVLKQKDADIAARILKLIDATSPLDKRLTDRISGFLAFADFRAGTLAGDLKAVKNSDVRRLVYTHMILDPEENHVFAYVLMLDDEDQFTRRYCAGGIEVVVRELLLKNRRHKFGFGEKEQEALCKMLSPGLDSEDRVVVQVAAGAIGRTGVKARVEKLAGLLKHDDEITARRAAISLGLMKAKEAVTPLLNVLREGRYALLPETADSLARIGDPSAFKPLLEMLGNEEVPFRELLLHAMAAVDLKSSAEVLPRFLSDANIAVRTLAVDRLVKAIRGTPGLLKKQAPGLLKIVKAGKPGGKFAAARVLGEAGDATVLPDLMKLAADEDPQVRSASFMPVAMIAGERARELFEKNLKEKDYQIRVHAAEALGYLGNWTEFVKLALVPIEVAGDSVVDALSRIACATGMNLVIDPAAVRMCSLDTCTVSENLRGKTILDSLNILKKRFDITWNAKHNALFVTVSARKDVLGGFEPPKAQLGCTGADIKVEKKLSTRLTCNSVSESMDTFFDKVSAKTGIPFEVDESVGKRIAESLLRIDFTVADMPLSSLLRLVLAPRCLSARISKGTIIIKAGK